MKKQTLRTLSYFKAEILPRNNRLPGFTIVELLIVIVAIGILSALSIVAYSGMQERALRAKEASVLRAYENALKIYQANTGSPARTDFPSLLGYSSTSYCLGRPSDYKPTETCMVGTGRNSSTDQNYNLVSDHIEEITGTKLPGFSGMFPGTNYRGLSLISGNRLRYMSPSKHGCHANDTTGSEYQGYVHCFRTTD